MKNTSFLPPEMIHRRVIALDYRDGYAFFDSSGRAVRRILEESEDWIFERNRDTCQFTDPTTNLSFKIAPNRMFFDQSLTLEIESLLKGPAFGARAEVLMRIVLDVLKVESISRIGYQVTHLYPTKSSSESYKLMSELAVCAVPITVIESIGEVFEMNRSIHLVRPDNLLRIQLSEFEQAVKIPQRVLEIASRKSHSLKIGQRTALYDTIKAKRMIEKRPQFGMQLDLDAYLTDPTFVAISDFVTTADADIIAIKSDILSKKQG